MILTGGGGFIGGHVRAALTGRDVLLLGRHAPDDLGPDERWAWLDLTASPWARLTEQRFAQLAVPDGAALVHLAYRPDEPAQTTTMSLGLVAAVNACPQVARVVLVSTVAVYGTTHLGLLDETAECRPRSAYGRAKLADERRWLTALRPDCELVVLRLGMVVAADRAASYSLVADAVRRPARATMLGSLRRVTHTHYVTAGNAAAAIRFAIDAPLPARRLVLNVVDDPADGGTTLRPAGPELADGEYAATQDAVRALAGRPPLRRVPLPAAGIDAAARLLGLSRPGQRFSAAALRAHGFVGPAPLGDELAGLVASLTAPAACAHSADACTNSGASRRC